MSGRVVIIGAGHAGGTAAALLRQYGYEGEIVLIGEEPLAPYQRPPLSKAWLKGEVDAEGLLLRPESFYVENGILLRRGVAAVKIAREARMVTLQSGESLSYDILILATGARARPLPVEGANLDGVLSLRSAADAEALKAHLGPGKTLAVIGGGYVGLEAAASARALGSNAVVIEREVRCLARVACVELSDFFQAQHRAHGVTFELNAEVDAIEGKKGKVVGVRLKDGRVLSCDAALVGIGAIANVELAKDAGLECTGGVVVDLNARTADPHVYAIGDVTHRPMPLYDRMFRLESVPNALEQAKQAAAHICGKEAPKAEVPWFWSDQYDLKLQIAGLPFDTDGAIVRGDPAQAKFAIFHLKGDRVMAVEAVNAAPEFMMGRILIGARTPVSREKLADPAVSMKEVAA